MTSKIDIKKFYQHKVSSKTENKSDIKKIFREVTPKMSLILSTKIVIRECCQNCQISISSGMCQQNCHQKLSPKSLVKNIINKFKHKLSSKRFITECYRKMTSKTINKSFMKKSRSFRKKCHQK